VDLGLAGRVALVTGASGGIGEACATALAAEGCRVVGTDIVADRIEERAAEDPERFGAVVADLSDADGPAAAVAHTIERFGRLDVLVCAGGVFGTARGGLFAAAAGAPASEITPAEWDRTLAINLRGSFLAAQSAITHMAAAGWGRVVVVGSVSGQMGGFGAGGLPLDDRHVEVGERVVDDTVARSGPDDDKTMWRTRRKGSAVSRPGRRSAGRVSSGGWGQRGRRSRCHRPVRTVDLRPWWVRRGRVPAPRRGRRG
jgi:NAD(P)-dependent dehydrogenase (short-subunit alcohol dehydrogenase family)